MFSKQNVCKTKRAYFVTHKIGDNLGDILHLNQMYIFCHNAKHFKTL